MRIVSPFKSAFLKASGYNTIRLFNENAAKITGITFGASDAMLSGFNYLKNSTFLIDIRHPTSDQFLSMSGMSYLTSSILFLGADRFPWMKKPVGALALLGGLFAAGAGYGANTPEFYVAAVPPILTGLSMMFENSANAMAEKFAHAKSKVAEAGKFYLKYPVATMAMLQTVGAAFAIEAGIRNHDQHLMIAYGLMWATGNMTMAMTDNNVKDRIRAVYTKTPAENPLAPSL